MESSPKVVYLLGAGASRFALPIVGEMPAAFECHLTWLKRNHEDVLAANDFGVYEKRIRSLAYFGSRFGTVDTYAKSLFLQGNKARLADVKLHLSLYFLLEQLSEVKYTSEEMEKNIFMRDRRQDLRYMGWLAVLLQNVKSINHRVSVVSWNYDLQIEHALAYYLDLEKPDLQNAIDTYNIFPNPRRPKKEWRELPFLVHLNGIAGHSGKDETCSEALFADLDKVEPGVFIKKLFERYKERESNGFYETMNTWFTFAWENQMPATKARELALKAMTNASILVVIGYSFPPFNRTLDQQLIQAFLPELKNAQTKRVHLQTPGVTKSDFMHLFGIGDRLPNIEVDDKVHQFYLPPELYAS